MNKWEKFSRTGPGAQECFEAFDSKVKNKVLNYIKKKCIKENPDNYGPDLVLKLPNREPLPIEVQIDTYWGREGYSIQRFLIPLRKERLKEYPNCQIWIVSHDLSMGAIIPVNKLTDDRKVFTPNKYRPDEISFSIPINECRIFSLSTLQE